MNQTARKGDGPHETSRVHAPHEFTDLLVYKNITPNQPGSSSNIIKADRIRMQSGDHVVEIPGNDGNQPTVLIHRAGNVVQSVEFLCKCGRSAIVGVEYEDE